MAGIGIGSNFSPGAVMMNAPTAAGSPYLNAPIKKTQQSTVMPNPSASTTVQKPGAPPPNAIGAQSVRAVGSGGGDAAWRQNLATFAGGQFARPGGMLKFNPTNASSFPGAPTGGGNAPLAGLPSDLLSQALNGQGASVSTPAASTPSPASKSPMGNDMAFWLNAMQNAGRGMRTFQ